MNTKKLFMIVAATFAATTLFTCEQVPDYCSDHNRYDPNMQFCFSGRAVDKCNGETFNPQTQGCISNSEVGTLCADSSVVQIGTLCGTHTLSIAAAPFNGGVVIGAENGDEFEADAIVPLVASANDGFTFAGWAGVANQTTDDITFDLHIRRNTSVIAMFRSSANELFTEAFPANSGTISVDPEKPVYTNGERVTVTATASDGFVFDGWSGASSSNSAATTITMDGGQTLVAIFKPVVHTLRVSAIPSDGGVIFVEGTAFSGAVNEIFESENVQLFARANDGFVFKKWSGDVSGTTSTTIVNLTNSNVNIIAHFERGESGNNGGDTPQSVTFYCPNNECVAEQGASRPSGCYSSQTSCELSFGADCTVGEDCTFDEGLCIISELCYDDFTRTACANIRGEFTAGATCPTYLVTVISEGAGATGGGNYKYGDTVRINAGTPPTDHRFMNWTTTSAGVNFGNAGSNTTLFIMPANEVTVTAIFREINNAIGESFTDERDGKVYRIVEIGDQVWMAENLNFATAEGSWCYDDDPANCAIYGRLYDWATAMAGASSSSANPSGVQRICPAGWHLPSNAEWDVLTNFVGINAGTKLKSETGWFDVDGDFYRPATDDFGFSALPGGIRNGVGSFANFEHHGYWWTTTQSDVATAQNRRMSYHIEHADSFHGDKSFGYSVRCVKY